MFAVSLCCTHTHTAHIRLTDVLFVERGKVFQNCRVYYFMARCCSKYWMPTVISRGTWIEITELCSKELFKKKINTIYSRCYYQRNWSEDTWRCENVALACVCAHCSVNFTKSELLLSGESGVKKNRRFGIIEDSTPPDQMCVLHIWTQWGRTKFVCVNHHNLSFSWNLRYLILLAFGNEIASTIADSFLILLLFYLLYYCKVCAKSVFINFWR